MVALESHGDVFTDAIWPPKPSLYGFWIVFTEGYWYLEYFWHQFGNSVYLGTAVTFLTLLIGSLASFSIGRMRIRHGWLVIERGAVDLCDPGLVPGDPVLPDHAELRAEQQSVVGDRGAGDVRHALCDLHLPAIRQEHPARARRSGAHRRRHAAPDLFAHLSAADGAGTGRGRHLCAAPLVERISLPVPAACRTSRA